MEVFALNRGRDRDRNRNRIGVNALRRQSGGATAFLERDRTLLLRRSVSRRKYTGSSPIRSRSRSGYYTVANVDSRNRAKGTRYRDRFRPRRRWNLRRQSGGATASKDHGAISRRRCGRRAWSVCRCPTTRARNSRPRPRRCRWSPRHWEWCPCRTWSPRPS